MLLVYTPEGAERQEFIFRPMELMSPDAEALEDVGGSSWVTFDEFGVKFRAGSIKAWRAALWVMLRRQDPKLRFSDLVIRVDEVDVLLEPDERDRIRAEIDKSVEMSEAEKQEALALMDDGQIPDIVVPEPEGKDEPGDESTDSP